MKYIIREIKRDEYDVVRKLDRDTFGYNNPDDADLHENYADKVRISSYFIPELDLVAVTDEGFIIGHAIFSALPMGDEGEHIIWLNSLAVKYDKSDNHEEKQYKYQRKGIGTAMVKHGVETAKILGYTGCITCGNPALYQKKMGFKNYRELGIVKDESVEDHESCVFAIELVPGGFNGTNKVLSYLQGCTIPD